MTTIINTLKNCITHRTLKRGLKGIILLTPLLIVGVVMAAPDPSADLLAKTVKGDITNNFGPTSTVMYCVYLIEIIVAAGTYIKTKNLFALSGILILLIFTIAGSAMFAG